MPSRCGWRCDVSVSGQELWLSENICMSRHLTGRGSVLSHRSLQGRATALPRGFGQIKQSLVSLVIVFSYEDCKVTTIVLHSVLHLRHVEKLLVVCDSSLRGTCVSTPGLFYLLSWAKLKCLATLLRSLCPQDCIPYLHWLFAESLQRPWPVGVPSGPGLRAVPSPRPPASREPH